MCPDVNVPPPDMLPPRCCCTINCIMVAGHCWTRRRCRTSRMRFEEAVAPGPAQNGNLHSITCRPLLDEATLLHVYSCSILTSSATF